MTALLPTLLLLAVLYGLASLFCCIETAFTSVNRTLIQNWLSAATAGLSWSPGCWTAPANFSAPSFWARI